MAPEPGTRLGTYEVIDLVGKGGMGEVYRARDTKLGREVALKVLPEAFARDPERLARFEKEARVLALLNHPNIAALYGLEESDDVPFLVMEYVPGETLAEILDRGPLPVDEARSIFEQTAEALEAAHEKGIVHRDLKPSNIMITPEGVVKVLDFGLAKALGDESEDVDPSESPTKTFGATKDGVIMGTAPYMSPEQARGKGVDRRTDIWAFGCCFYEALTCKKAFHGETVTDTLAAIVKNEPDWEALPEGIPRGGIRKLIARCLRKDRGERFRSAVDTRLYIEDALAEPEAKGIASAPRRNPVPTIVSAVLASIATALAFWALSPPEPRSVKRFSILFPDIDYVTDVNISPDGSHLVFQGPSFEQLYLRRLDELEARPIPGTEGAFSSFFSPDGRWVGFYSDGKLQKVSLSGGPPVTLYATEARAEGSWGPDDTIVFGSMGKGLSRVSAGGGTPTILTTLDREGGETGHRWPEVLPGGKAVLFTNWFDAQSASSVSQWMERSHIAVYSLETGEHRILVEGGSNPRYVSTGHIVFARPGSQLVGPGSLLAVPFDLDRLEVRGQPVPVLEGPRVDWFGAAQFALSEDGSLVYNSSSASGPYPESILVSVDRKGMPRRLIETPRIFENPCLSPDGGRLAVGIEGPSGLFDIWIIELARSIMTRLTFKGFNYAPIWTPDGSHVTFSSNRAGGFNIFSKPADGSGDAVQLTRYESDSGSWSPDGENLAFAQRRGAMSFDIGILPLEGEAQFIVDTPFDERHPMISPDGLWLAYTSDESGQNEVYVRPFPGPGGRWQVSTEGGTEPRWARSGDELFYREADKMMAVSVSNEPELTLGKPVVLFEGQYQFLIGGGYSNYDVSPDGRSFVMIESVEEVAPVRQLTIVLNWFEELKQGR